MVIFQEKNFCQQIEAAVPIRDAKRFWLLTIFLAWLPIVGAWLLPILTVPRLSPWREVREMLVYSVLVPIPISAFIVIGMLFFFAAATGMPGYFCHPRSLPIEQQNRAIALSYFASAPIAMTPLLILFLILAAIARPLPKLQLFLWGALVLSALAVLTLWYTRTVGIVLTLSRRPRRNFTALLLTLSWFVALLLCLLVIPTILLYTAALIYSMF